MNVEPNIPDADAMYAAILAANEGVGEAESLGFALRLALILANQVGDQAVVMAAIAAARDARGNP